MGILGKIVKAPISAAVKVVKAPITVTKEVAELAVIGGATVACPPVGVGMMVGKNIRNQNKKDKEELKKAMEDAEKAAKDAKKAAKASQKAIIKELKKSSKKKG